jgi:hypoxanthine phosphoribosyltransferase
MTPNVQSFENLKLSLSDIVQQITASGFIPQLIIGPGRGGYVPGVMLSHYYGCAFEGFVWQTRDGDHRDSESLIRIISRYPDLNILCVDDINDSGNTLLSIKQVLKDNVTNFENKVKFCTVFNNIESKFMAVDYYAIELHPEDKRWVIFPYEEWWKHP